MNVLQITEYAVRMFLQITDARCSVFKTEQRAFLFLAVVIRTGHARFWNIRQSRITDENVPPVQRTEGDADGLYHHPD